MATFFKKKSPLPPERRRALRNRLRRLLADQAWLEERINWLTDPHVQKFLVPIKAEIATIEALL